MKYLKDRIIGLSLAFLIIGSWAMSIILLFNTAVAEIPLWLLPIVMIWQMFLYTGLFITAHDAMHGTVFPGKKAINKVIGSLAVFSYALFSYKKLLAKHWEHHRHPASDHDPDYHDGEHTGFWAWYFHFMKNYLSILQLVGITIAFNALQFIAGVPLENLMLFWVIPSLMSTLQLFYYGTYLPHRQPADGYDDHHRASSNQFSTFWSFITCYHFGYHWEHHEFPYVPWWKLPEKRREILAEQQH